jgi:hypothetical protein
LPGPPVAEVPVPCGSLVAEGHPLAGVPVLCGFPVAGVPGAVTAGHRGEMTGRLPSHCHKTEQTDDRNGAISRLRVKSGDIRPR